MSDKMYDVLSKIRTLLPRAVALYVGFATVIKVLPYSDEISSLLPFVITFIDGIVSDANNNWGKKQLKAIQEYKSEQ